MNLLYSTSVFTSFGEKHISVIHGSVLDLPDKTDVLTISAFKRDYSPIYGTLIGSLYVNGVDVEQESHDPYLDLRDICNVWLSGKINDKIGHIGCLEMQDFYHNEEDEHIIKVIKAYFQMLDIASTSGIDVSTVALPLLGGGNQQISANLTLIPIINECISFLQRNEKCDKIIFVEINEERARAFAEALHKMYSLNKPVIKPTESNQSCVFISYRSLDRNIADNLCHKFESRGVRVWYAPRNVVGDYATAIVNAISACTHFVVIISENSLKSEHVLNEIDLAFNNSPRKIKMKPLRIDDVQLSPAFRYYLSRQHWMDAIVPPVEERLESFVDAVCDDMY